jgi:hypothetical protein
VSEIVFHDLPDLVGVDIEVVVNQDMPHPGGL